LSPFTHNNCLSATDIRAHFTVEATEPIDSLLCVPVDADKCDIKLSKRLYRSRDKDKGD